VNCGRSILTLTVAVLWHAIAADRPSKWRFGIGAEEQQLLDSIGTEGLQKVKFTGLTQNSQVDPAVGPEIPHA
jgi:hypothetical protein